MSIDSLNDKLLEAKKYLERLNKEMRSVRDIYKRIAKDGNYSVDIKLLFDLYPRRKGEDVHFEIEEIHDSILSIRSKIALLITWVAELQRVEDYNGNDDFEALHF
ncbi:MAG: hypothetical protein IKN64_02895 [Desulfovibrio sp.]|nr:hypothetical protein [Desulfovibrio sp.]